MWGIGSGLECLKNNRGFRILSKPSILLVAGATRIELATSGVTGRIFYFYLISLQLTC